MDIQDTIIFNGTEYTRLGQRKYYISKSNTNEGRKGAKGLHTDIWEYYNGREVPKGYHIHHKDGNALNNDISNLECIPSREHLKIHAEDRKNNKEYQEKNFRALEKAREAAKEWHSSDEGREWHSKHGKEVFANRQPETHICAECGKEYSTIQPWSKFCCDRCGELWRRKHRKIEYKAICKVCGKEFAGYKDKPSSRESNTCSKECRALLGHKTRDKKKESL